MRENAEVNFKKAREYYSACKQELERVEHELTDAKRQAQNNTIIRPKHYTAAPRPLRDVTWMNRERRTERSARQTPDVRGRQIFVNHLSQTTTEETLRHFYSLFGTVVECYVKRKETPKGSHSFGFVTFATMTEAQDALAFRSPTIDGEKVTSVRAHAPSHARR
ncbi:heterogeneous nuclear ribonucleaoprotein A2B1 [Aphelenchoides avenae]|nr:heterogeneous nuclear ribonucleaoprotein A2B1 [Aphelenchus avenae]